METSREKNGKRSLKEYALYKGDEFVDIGTSVMLYEAYGISGDFLSYLVSPTGRRKCESAKNPRGWIALRLED